MKPRRITTTRVLDEEGLARVLEPRDDVVRERRDDGRFLLDEGPFTRYERRVTIGQPDGDGRLTVTETFEYALPPCTWGPLISRAMGSTLRRPSRPGHMPWWAPPQRPDPRAATVLGLLATVAVVVGYLGTLLTQTMTFAADEFGTDNTGQSIVLAAARVGVLLAIPLTTLGDRRGRRGMLRVALCACVATTVLGALSPNLAGLAATQVASRGTFSAAAILVLIMAAEEMPAGARAYAVSLLAMAGALGAGMALWILPIADLDERAWRILYLIPLASLPLIVWVFHRLPETRRYVRPHRDLALAGHTGRLWLLVSAGFLLNLFTTPASQFRNQFLRDDRGFSAGLVSLFVIVTSTPGGIGIVAGGRLADTRGRRRVGAASAVIGAALGALSFALDGASMWITATAATIVMAAVIPTLQVYVPELFPTSLRGRANGLVRGADMIGSVAGLLVAGILADALGSFGPALGLLAIGPALMAAVVITRYPETARRELEEINPEDQAAAGERSG